MSSGLLTDNAKFAGGDDGDTDYQDGSFGNHALSTMSETEKGWDGSIMKYVPHALRGLKPVTNEPWARDEAVYRKNDGMDEVSEARPPACLPPPPTPATVPPPHYPCHPAAASLRGCCRHRSRHPPLIQKPHSASCLRCPTRWVT